MTKVTSLMVLQRAAEALHVQRAWRKSRFLLHVLCSLTRVYSRKRSSRFCRSQLISSGMMVAGAPLARGFLDVSVPGKQRGMANGFLQAGWSLGLALGAAVAGYLGDRIGLGRVLDWCSCFLWPLESMRSWPFGATAG